MDRDFWASLSHDPHDARFRSMRASDQDRAVVQQALTEAYADGRLDRAEFDERDERAVRSRTLGELAAIVGDLVAPAPPATTGSGLAAATPADLHQRAVEKYVTDRRESVFGFFFITIVCTTIWLLTTGPGHFPWPAFVVLIAGLKVARTVSRKREIVAGYERRLERKRARELRRPWRPEDPGTGETE